MIRPLLTGTVIGFAAAVAALAGWTARQYRRNVLHVRGWRR